MNGNVIRTITIRGQSEGLDKLQGDLVKLAAAHQGVTVATEQTEKSTLSLEQAWNKQTLKLDEAARAQANIARESKIANDAQRQGRATQEQLAQRLDQINQRYGQVTTSAKQMVAGMSTAGDAGAVASQKMIAGLSEVGNAAALAAKQMDKLAASAKPTADQMASSKLTAGMTAAGDTSAVASHKIISGMTAASKAADEASTSVKSYSQIITGMSAAGDVSAVASHRMIAGMSGAAQGAHGAAKAIGLTSYETLNLSRQLADIGVSLQAGQSPFTVFVQQGAQILDIIQTTRGTLGGFFTQAIGWAGRFVTSTAGVVTGLGAIAAAAAYMGSSFAAAQRDIERALASTGRPSGVSASGINRIAEQAAGRGMSVGEARESATAFAATGRIYEANILKATQVTRDFALVMGVEAKDASKTFAEALVDPAKGALDLEKTLKSLDAATLNQIRSLQASGDLQGAQRVLLDAVDASVQKQMGNVGYLTQAWNMLAGLAGSLNNAMSKPLVDQSVEAQLESARAKQASFIESAARGAPVVAAAYQAISQDVARLEGELNKISQTTADARLSQLSLDADAVVRSITPAIAQVKRLTENLATLERMKAESTQVRSGPLDPALQASIEMERMKLALAQEGIEVERRKAEVFNETAKRYPEVSAAVAQILDVQKAELRVVEAIGETAKANAQYELDVLRAKQQGLALSEQISIADGKRRETLAEINAQEMANNKAKMSYNELYHTYGQAEADRIKNAQSNVTSGQEKVTKATNASSAANRIYANGNVVAAGTMAELNQLTRTYSSEMETNAEGIASWSAQHDEAVLAANRLSNAVDDETASINAAVLAMRKYLDNLDAMSYVPTIALGGQLYQSKQGGYSQFNPQGYTSTYKTDQYYSLLAQYGQGGFDENTGAPNAQGLEYAFNKSGGMISGGIMESSRYMPSGGVDPYWGTTGQVDMSKVSLAQRAIDLMPKEQQAGPLQQLIKSLQSAPYSLAGQEAIKSLTEKLEQLTQATEQNTSATSAMTDVLSPFYSSDPRRTHLGFRAFAGGGIMTQYGELPLRHYQGGGMATSPQVAVYGEGSTPEAYVPVPSGRIPVEIRQPANSNQRPVIVNIRVMGNADAGTVAALKQTSFQKAQQLRRITG